MGIVHNTTDIDGEQGGTRPFPAPPASGPPVPASPGTPRAAAADGRSELQRRRDALAEQVTELHWDLGGLAYEMAIRDHFRLDVLVRRAALLQERDAELAEVERLLRMEQDGVAGSCPSCAAPHSRGALYCWQCGITLMERRTVDADAGHDGAASVMDALLAQQVAPGSEPAASSDE
ncbi:MAG: hypothetical protein ABSG93_14245 [Solirubrobacteraceae bacterium]|jgi:hypothetical protein